MTQVNTRAAHDASVSRLTALQAQLDSVQGQIATGKRVTVPADDPIAFSRAATLRRAEAAGAAQGRAVDAAARRLGATDTALSGITELVQRARELALQGANGTLSADDRATLATEVAELARQAASLADSRGDDGERLFGGASAGGPAYAADATTGAAVWQGGGSAPLLAFGTSTLATGLTGPEAFGDGPTGLFATLDGLAAALAEPDAVLRGAALDTAIGNLDGQVSGLADGRAMAGARLARLDAEGTRIDKAKFDIQVGLTTLEGLDMTEAIARLQRLSTVLQAAQASFVKVSALSLWDQLR